MSTNLQPGRLTLVVASRFETAAVSKLVEGTLDALPGPWGTAGPAVRARWQDLESQPVLPGGGAGTEVLLAYNLPQPACTDCSEAAVASMGEQWLEVLGGTRLGDLLSSKHNTRQMEEARATPTPYDRTIPIYPRNLNFYIWELGADRILQADLGSVEPHDEEGHLSELAGLPDDLAIQSVVFEDDVEALKRWNRWKHTRATLAPRRLVQERLRSATARDAVTVADVSADEVQAWLEATLSGSPTRKGTYE